MFDIINIRMDVNTCQKMTITECFRIKICNKIRNCVFATLEKMLNKASFPTQVDVNEDEQLFCDEEIMIT